MEPLVNKRYAAFISVAVIVFILIGAAVYLKLKPSQQLQNASEAPVNAQLAAGQTAPEKAKCTCEEYRH